MSDLIDKPGANRPGLKTAQPTRASVPLSLHDLIRNSLRKVVGSENNPRIIMRCSSLPMITARKKDFQELFDLLAAMLLSPRTHGDFLINVICDEPAQAEGTDAVIVHHIKFYTGVPYPADWKLIHNESILRCKFILSAYGATLMVNAGADSGCAFTLSIPA